MPAKIIKAELVTCPPVRFIGRKYDSYPDWNIMWETDGFTTIENAGKTADINDGSYCVLVGQTDAGQEFYIGEFMEPDTTVPEGFDYADLPELRAGLFFIKGKIMDCYQLTKPCERAKLQAALAEAGAELPEFDIPGKRWLSFERDNCPRWTDPDEEGNLILDYAVYL